MMETKYSIHQSEVIKRDVFTANTPQLTSY